MVKPREFCRGYYGQIFLSWLDVKCKSLRSKHALGSGSSMAVEGDGDGGVTLDEGRSRATVGETVPCFVSKLLDVS